MLALHSPACHASADLARECATCQVDAREAVDLIAAQLWPVSESPSVSVLPSASSVTPLPAAVERSTHRLNQITLALAVPGVLLTIYFTATSVIPYLASLFTGGRH